MKQHGYTWGRVLDALSARLSTKIDLFGQRRSAFRICGIAGLAAMTMLMAILAAASGRSVVVALLLVCVAAGSFLAYAWIWKRFTGYEEIVYYRGLIAVLLASAGFLALIGLPVLPYLDILVPGIGIFSACGRCGCLMVGCCHGLPGRRGICYREEHAREGFPRPLIGVRLIPVQLLDLIWIVVIVSVGVAMLLGDSRPGAVLAWYLVGYSTGRFLLEFLRGDPERPRALGLSEAQWTGLVILQIVVLLGVSGAMPVAPWQKMVNGLVLLTGAWAVGTRRRGSGRIDLDDPSCVIEIVRALRSFLSDAQSRPDVAVSKSEAISVRTIGDGVRLSGSVLSGAHGPLYHLALSGAAVSSRDAERIGRLASIVIDRELVPEVVEGGSGVTHLLLHPAADLVWSGEVRDRDLRTEQPRPVLPHA
jgi:prolipoprotein diacylglyceryltransferase